MAGFRHYPFVTRMIIDLFEAGQLPAVSSIEVEPEFGYVARLNYREGRCRVTFGNDIGLNSSAAVALARDKAYTKHMMVRSGFSLPAGETFLLDWWSARVANRYQRQGGPALRTRAHIDEFVAANSMTFPVFVKPVNGTMGTNVYACHSLEEVHDVMDQFERSMIKVALLEEAVTLPDFRLVVLDEEVISAYARHPLTVVGDGRSTIDELVAIQSDLRVLSGRPLDANDPRIVATLARLGMSLASIPRSGERVRLQDASNLSLGGRAEDLTETVHESWSRLAVAIADSLNLRFCGIDLACADLTRAGDEYFVYEANGTPGLDLFSIHGDSQARLVRELYARVLNAIP